MQERLEVALLDILAFSLGNGDGLASASGDVWVIGLAEGICSGFGTGTAITDAWLVIPNQAEGSGIGSGLTQPYVIIETDGLGSGLGIGAGFGAVLEFIEELITGINRGLCFFGENLNQKIEAKLIKENSPVVPKGRFMPYGGTNPSSPRNTGYIMGGKR